MAKNVPHLEITKVAVIHCNTVNNDYQQDLRLKFIPNKSFGQLPDISSKKFYIFENF